MISVKSPVYVNGWPGYQWRRKIAENFNRLSRVHERTLHTTNDRQTDERQHIANVNVSSRSLKIYEHHIQVLDSNSGILKIMTPAPHPWY